MLRLFEDLPVELVGTNVFGYLSLKDIVLLERACGSNESHHAFMNITPYCPPIEIPYCKVQYLPTLYWFAKRQCKVDFLNVSLTGICAWFNIHNIIIEKCCLQLVTADTVDCLKDFLRS